MAENLKVTHYNNGDEIPTGLNDSDWSSTEEGAYAVYDDDPANAEVYGNLYNWYAVDDEEACVLKTIICQVMMNLTLEMFLGMSQAEADVYGWDRGQIVANLQVILTFGQVFTLLII